jgi:acetylornithine deacetylase/succinyl-diaminopimelate desuccinylase-like protein
MPASPVELLRELIRIPSVNPDGDPGTDLTGEAELATWLAAWLEARGFTVTLEEIKPGRPNLIARAPGPDDRPRILLGPHLDTVGVGGMTVDPFAAEIRDDKIWGRGASDTKGPMAAMLWSLHECRDLLASLPVAVDFVAFMAEESGQWGSRDFADRHASDYQFALVGEPTALNLVHVTKGALWATLTATGKAAHSSQPERGDNAILKLTRSLDFLDRELRKALGQFRHPVLGPSTLNIGTIIGGTRANIVPDHAEAQIDIRTVPALTTNGGALAFVESFLATHQLPITINGMVENPPMEVPDGHPWLQRIRQVHPGSQPTGAPWFSDAAHLTTAGLPAICVGPGSINQAHTVDEFISIADIEAGAAWYTALVRALA